MAFVPGFEHDIFISYVHANNFGGDDDLWVNRFHRALKQELTQHTGLTSGNLQIRYAHRIAKEGDYDWANITDVQSSALFLAINSNAYRQSAYCQMEIESFHERARNGRYGICIGKGRDRSRMFHLLINPQPFSDWPEAFQDKLAYNFYDAETGFPLKPDSTQFQLGLRVLASELARTLFIFRDWASHSSLPTSQILSAESQSLDKLFLKDVAQNSQSPVSQVPAAEAQSPKRVFLNYRREDSAGDARGVYEKLSNHFGGERVFWDIGGIEIGEDFVEKIQTEVGACQVLIALLGRQWLKCVDGNGNRRIDNPDDFVRLEIVSALERGIKVIPILLHGATMPTSDQLPDQLKPFARRNALELSNQNWESSVGKLIESIEKYLA